MKQIILLLALIVSLGSNAWAGNTINPLGDGDHLPWPWGGTECPFPWEDIPGTWKVETKSGLHHTFEFEITNVLSNGSRVFEVRRYNHDGEMVAKGRGLSPAGQRVVRAAVNSLLPHEGAYSSTYWVIVRSYVEEENVHFCTPESRITLVTTRPLAESCGPDSHYVIEKIPGEPATYWYK